MYPECHRRICPVSWDHVMRLINNFKCFVINRLTLGRPSSPILIDKTVSPVVKDAPVDISQVSLFDDFFVLEMKLLC